MSATIDKVEGVPARIEPDEDSYRGRFSARLFTLRKHRDVAEIVKAVRKAGFSKVTRSTYYNWEGGKTDPPIAALPAIAKALGVKIADLFPA